MSNIAFELFAKLGLDSSEYEKGLGNAKSIAGTIGGGIKTAFGVGTAAIGAATAAIGAFAGASVKGYAEYEQLVGGVDKLYGEASGKLQQYANEAYKTAGMSANEYMETATSFSAALVNSLGGDVNKAADMTDVAMRAISDNVNTFGSDMGSVTNAFQGFAKQNYTMLDNLKLGYGGTKSEMERLIADANEYRASIGETANLSINSFADVVQAIQSVQEAQHIAGTTNKEAMSTIEGSAAATKAAWQNVITAIAGGGDLGNAFDGLVTSIFGAKEGEGFLNQVIPRIETTMEGIGTFIEKAAPYVTDKLPALVSSILPSALKGATTLLKAIGDGIIKSLPTVIETAKTVISTIGTSLVDNAPSLVTSIADVLRQMVEMFTENAPQLVSGAIALLTGLAKSLVENAATLIPAVIQLLLSIALALIENAPLILKTIIDINIAIVQALIQNAPLILDAIIQVVQAILALIIDYGGQFFTSAAEIIGNLTNSVGEWMANVINNIATWLSQLPTTMAYYAGFAIASFLKFFMDLPENLKTWFVATKQKVIDFGTEVKNEAISIGKNFFNGIVDNIKNLPNRLKSLGSSLVAAVASLPSKFAEVGKNIVSGLWNGISSGWDWLKEQVSNLANSLLEGAKAALDIHSPSKKFMWIGRMVDEGFAKGLNDFSYLVTDVMDRLTNVGNITPRVAFADGMTSMPVGGYNQTVNIYSPTALTPSEVARQTRNATRDMVLELRGKR